MTNWNTAGTLTLEKLTRAMDELRGLMPVPPHELRASKMLPRGTFYVCDRSQFDREALLPQAERVPLVICAEGDERAVSDHLARHPDLVPETRRPRPAPRLRFFDVFCA